MLGEEQITMIVQIVLIISAINWGLVAYNGTDLVKTVSPLMGAHKGLNLKPSVSG